MAEPEGYGAAPLALEVNVLCSVLLTVGDSGAHESRRALRADQILSSILACRSHLVAAVVHPAEVRVFAFKAHVVGAFEESELLQIVVESIIGVPQSRLFVKAFQACPFNSFALDNSFDLAHSFEFLSQGRTMVQSHGLLARRTIHEGEDDSRGGPLVGDYLLDALDVEHVPATEFHARLGSETTYPADSAVGILVSILQQEPWIVLISSGFGLFSGPGCALSVEAWEAFLLAKEAPARMPTAVRLVAILPDHILALLTQADIIENTCFAFLLFLLIRKLVAAESALLRVDKVLVLITILARVVGRDPAPVAENALALPAANPVLAHVDGGSRRH